MQILVTGDEKIARSFFDREPGTAIIKFLKDDAGIKGSQPQFAVLLDFEFTRDAERIKAQAQNNPGCIFIIGSVYHTLDGFPSNVVRINNWKTFLERKLAEAACPDDVTRKRTEELFALFEKETEWTPDIPGFLSARVVAMIVNEAYFTLQDKVSSREDIDTAMKLGTNYPYGPFEWSKIIGLKNILRLLEVLSASVPRYQPAELLKKEAVQS